MVLFDEFMEWIIVCGVHFNIVYVSFIDNQIVERNSDFKLLPS